MTNHQSKIERLIAELCPNGVEFKELGELGEFYGGLSGKSKDDFSNGNAKFVTYMNIYSNTAINTDIDIFVKISKDENQNKIEYGDVLFTGSSETPDECGMSSVLTKRITEPLYLNSFCFGFRFHNTNLFLPEFSKYLFRDEQMRKQIAKTASGVTRFNVSKKRFAKMIIPLPPLAVQEEIVKILNSFTELEAELEARKKQYEHYREELLFDEKYQYLTFDKLCTINQGLQVPISDRKTEPGENRFFYITVQFLKKNIENFYIENPSESVVCNEDDILVTRTGSTGKIITGVNGCFHNNFFKMNYRAAS